VPAELRIAVGEADAMAFACNAVNLGETVIVNRASDALEKQLARHGYRLRATPLDEFLKAGGSAKCLTLRLDEQCARRLDRAGIQNNSPCGEGGRGGTKRLQSSLRSVRCEARALERQRETAFEQIGIHALSAHAAAEAAVVVLAAAQLGDGAHHVSGTLGHAASQSRNYLVRQAQQHVAGRNRAVLARRFQHGFQPASFTHGITGAITPDRHAGIGQRLHRAQPGMRRAARGSSLEDRRLSSVVTEKCTCTRSIAASGASRSRSRSISAFLVISENGAAFPASPRSAAG
jgi:hypothetical protein